MYQKDLIRNLWKSAGLYDINDAKLQQFLALLDDPTQCWSELIQTARISYPTYKAQLAQPILASGDALAQINLIRAASGPDELAMLKTFISKADPVRDEASLYTIALKNQPVLNKALARKSKLTAPVKGALAFQEAALRAKQAPRRVVVPASVATAPAET